MNQTLTQKKKKIKDSVLNPLPKNIREFRRFWLKDQCLSYSDKQIEWLLRKILRENKKFITLGNVTYSK